MATVSGDGAKFDKGHEDLKSLENEITPHALSDEVMMAWDSQKLVPDSSEKYAVTDFAQMEQEGRNKYMSLPQDLQNTYQDWVDHFLDRAKGNPRVDRDVD